MPSGVEEIKVDTSRRVLALDGIRALAALAVVGFHLGLEVFGGGEVGVDWFFVLSGFLVTSVLLNEIDRDRTIDVVRFMRRRVVRLVPALAATLLVILGAVALLEPDLIATASREALASALYVSNVTALGAEGIDRFFLHTWTLSLEMQFYLVLPFIVLGLRRLGLAPVRQVRAYIALGVVAAMTRVVGAVAFDTMPAVISWPVFDIDRFAFGIAMAIALRSSGFLRLKLILRSVPLACVLFVGLLADVYLSQFWPHDLRPLHNLLICSAVAVVIGHLLMVPGSQLARVLNLRLLTFIGTISYSLYLWHFPIFELLRADVVFAGDNPVRAAAKLPLSFLVAWISYRLLERPAMRKPRPEPGPSEAASTPSPPAPNSREHV